MATMAMCTMSARERAEPEPVASAVVTKLDPVVVDLSRGDVLAVGARVSGAGVIVGHKDGAKVPCPSTLLAADGAEDGTGLRSSLPIFEADGAGERSELFSLGTMLAADGAMLDDEVGARDGAWDSA